ncbi:hypothetical protein [Streptomyces sp. CT34]|uniref:hypothetical protein n=1 Tax=Streptomyces sp. CT34 TaxID=1553907 RepID=UPI0005B93B3B|nr:hypothetical protein [Streptomyces sp. CT34]
MTTDTTHALNEWCGHAQFIPLPARHEVARQMTRLRRSIQEHLDAEGSTDVNVYVSGSLARGEPTVQAEHPDRYRLVSDIDLLAVVQDKAADGHPAHGLETRLRATCPGLDPTVFVAPAARLGALRSFFARDMYVAFDRPLATGFPLAAPPPPPVAAAEQFEVFTHHLAAWLLGPTTEGGRKDPDSAPPGELARVRMLADCLWMLHDVPEDDTLRYAHAYRHRAELRGDAAPAEAEQIIRAREVLPGAGERLPDPVQRMTNSLAHFLSCGDTAPGTERALRVADELAVRACGHHDLLSVFQWTLPLYALLAMGQPVRRRAADAITEAWRHLDSSQLVASHEALERLVIIEADRLVTGSGAFAETAGPLRTLRKDYYHHLGARNFGHDTV